MKKLVLIQVIAVYTIMTIALLVVMVQIYDYTLSSFRGIEGLCKKQQPLIGSLCMSYRYLVNKLRDFMKLVYAYLIIIFLTEIAYLAHIVTHHRAM